jgi:hypothetical protein
MTVDIVTALSARRDVILAQLAAMTSTSIGGRPDAVGPGLNLREMEFRKSLYDELKEINKQLLANDIAVVETQEW